jgi:hypothetical protein
MLANTENRILKMLHERTPGYHPLLALVELATDKETDKGIQMQCHKTVAEYVEPKLKSMEIKADVHQDFGILKVSMLTDEVSD